MHLKYVPFISVKRCPPLLSEIWTFSVKSMSVIFSFARAHSSPVRFSIEDRFLKENKLLLYPLGEELFLEGFLYKGSKQVHIFEEVISLCKNGGKTLRCSHFTS